MSVMCFGFCYSDLCGSKLHNILYFIDFQLRMLLLQLHWLVTCTTAVVGTLQNEEGGTELQK